MGVAHHSMRRRAGRSLCCRGYTVHAAPHVGPTLSGSFSMSCKTNKRWRFKLCTASNSTVRAFERSEPCASAISRGMACCGTL